ncbi:MAG: hypothetical protein A3A80_01150 [Candidatus Terrybacteria bacterium RIFCSPLOWO2_01_FULL_44_24]|uniref:PsbP C-terminal domain-containing protein n=1 Tax=Candidatus Terrybacteria bacterium RIFCSPHIGHO2_01_FULL_43_35 TaxID=1802361 RepID=A0A1G2PF98_9BACT|nr:MAG: hypothetical protein A2828_03530 [Candidatus Terrybacteria bacterium RIFCSPHIGHO2_01_FULL_43_35]OHA50400.1 MAG: hypothetical protein A3B75_02590 [Candidatus Terrybacteria bacterium RIFCSPHIGHO2_02_FULL_43_14]OHA51690.1 MAG: hypothetical protein A3A80_01150 [Candidatus Terrybacteria bacterium RIFCSPLOWO2_01_FULL_44_24]
MNIKHLKITPIIIIILVAAVIVILAVFWYKNSSSIQNNSGVSLFPQLERYSEVPADWLLFSEEKSGYWLYYPPDWVTDDTLKDVPEVKVFLTKEKEPSEGFFIIRAITEPGQSDLSYLDGHFAETFRKQAVEGTLREENVNIQGRDSKSLEAKVINADTKKPVDAYLLVISGQQNNPAYAMSAIIVGPNAPALLEQVQLMTRSLRFF